MGAMNLKKKALGQLGQQRFQRPLDQHFFLPLVVFDKYPGIMVFHRNMADLFGINPPGPVPVGNLKWWMLKAVLTLRVS